MTDEEKAYRPRAAEREAERLESTKKIMELLIETAPKADPIRNGVKPEQATVSMQIRVLKLQAEMLKVASFLEGRPATAILRDLLKAYFAAKETNPNDRERQLWLNTVAVMAERE